MMVRVSLVLVALVFALPCEASAQSRGLFRWRMRSWRVPARVTAASTAPEGSFVMPAEFERIESIWMAYPVFDPTDESPVRAVQAEMIKALVPSVRVDLLVQNQAEEKIVQEWLKELRLEPGRVRTHIVPHTDIWLRDMGPIFLKNSAGQLKIADFRFNTWSYNEESHPDAVTDEAVDRLIARQLQLPFVRSQLISEGGDREFNGRGTLMVTEAVELQRNPRLRKPEIEAELKRMFGVKKVIWLKRGVADDDLTYKGKLPGDLFTVLTTGGHIDEFARFVGPSTVLLAAVSLQEAMADPIARITYERMEENFRILQSATDQDGLPLEVIRVPVPSPIVVTMDEQDEVYKLLQKLKFEDGTVIAKGSSIKTLLAASYLNFVIASDVVLVPSYWKEGRAEAVKHKDEGAQEIFRRVFPGRRIVPINPESINAGGGGMHCIVQQMPASSTR